MTIWLILAILGWVALLAAYQLMRRRSDPAFKKNFRAARKPFIFLILFYTFSLASFLVLNAGGLTSGLRYDLVTDFNSDLKQNRILELSQNGEYTAPQEVSGIRLIIPKIGVDTPIAFPASNSNESVLASLEEGVGLYPGSAPLGQTGRAVLLGHSSRASWYNGQYAYVFSLLPRVSVGDEFYVAVGLKRYHYKVIATNVLSRDDANKLLSSPTSVSEVALMTCYPIGSAAERTIVRGELLKS